MFSSRSDDDRPPASSHNNSQHVLAVVIRSANHNNDDALPREPDYEGDNEPRNRGATEPQRSTILEAFSATSDLPIAVRDFSWRESDSSENGKKTSSTILLASNYPNCILEGDQFCVLSAGFPYRYRDAFSSETPVEPGTETAGGSAPKTFSRTVLDYCETLVQNEHESDGNEETTIDSIEDAVGRCLKRVSGHFSLFLVHKTERRLWAWNDPFGFMPIYYHHNQHGSNKSGTSRTVLSSHWDCLVPATTMRIHSPAIAPSNPELDWDVVAEYLTLGTTLGGGREGDEAGFGRGFDRTFVKGIQNFCPGTCLSIEASTHAIACPTTTTTSATAKTGRANGRDTPAPPTAIKITTRPYIACYGACEGMLPDAADARWKDDHSIENLVGAKSSEANRSEPSTPSSLRRRRSEGKGSNQNYRHHHVKGIKVAPDNRTKTLEDCSKNSPENNAIDPSLPLYDKILTAIASCVEEAVGQGHVGRAALTGGGDTRLILACLLIVFQQQQQQQDQRRFLPEIIFQTHSKQRTDWQIARHLARTLRLEHERINPIGAPGNFAFDRLVSKRRREEALLSHLHHQIPLRQAQKCHSDRYKEETLQYTLHGRFGTEFLGCLCYNKSPLDLRTRDHLEGFRPKANRWFRVIFPSHDGKNTTSNHDNDAAVPNETAMATTAVRNPLDTLEERFRELEADREVFGKHQSIAAAAPQGTADKVNHEIRAPYFDVSYALQLQLYTRAFLSDIYKGLRGGSWFSMPTAQFTHNAITPFLDNTLLQTMLCSVATGDKEEPYRFYGKLYQSCSSIPDILRSVPSNNKLLCLHTTIPRAIKAPEAKAHPCYPRCVATDSTGWRGTRTRHDAHNLRERFRPVFWEGAIAVFEAAPTKLDADRVRGDPRESVRSLVELVGSAEDVCLLSGRLQSFLLWYERRFLVHVVQR